MIEHRIGASRRAAVAHRVTKGFVRPMLRYSPMTGPTTKIMPLMDRAAMRLPRSSRTVHKDIVARHWTGELVTPVDGVTSDGAVLYLHGGAFLSCGLGTHRRVVERLATGTGMPVLAVCYRQLPKCRLDGSIADCVDAFRWLVRHGHAPSRIVVVGDSAGGHLAFATTLRLRDEGAGTPAGLVALSPWLDFDHMAKVCHYNARRDAYIPVQRFRKLARMVVGAAPELSHSPVNADLRGLPPTLMICAEAEVLRVDAELMADRLDDAGVPCTLQIWEGQMHAFPVLVDLVPEARMALKEMSAFARQAVAAPAYRAGRDEHLPSAVGGSVA